MIVCHCHSVTDREIRACIQNGARTCGDVADACGASTGCGGCEPLVADIVATERRRLTLLRSEVTASPLGSLGVLGEAAALAG